MVRNKRVGPLFFFSEMKQIIIPEHMVHSHVESERADLFTCYDACSTEVEYLEFWAALVRITKPKDVLETGSFRGWGSLHIGQALQQNGMGKLVSIEIADEHYKEASWRIEKNELNEQVEVVQADVQDFLKETDRKFDLAFFDTELDMRMDEFRICLDRKLLERGGFAVFHDSSKERITRPHREPDPATKAFWEEFEKIGNEYDLEGRIQFPLSRGLLVVKV